VSIGMTGSSNVTTSFAGPLARVARTPDFEQIERVQVDHVTLLSIPAGSRPRAPIPFLQWTGLHRARRHRERPHRRLTLAVGRRPTAGVGDADVPAGASAHDVGRAVARRDRVVAAPGQDTPHMWMPTILRVARWDGWVVVPLVKAGWIPGSWRHRKGHLRAWYRWAKRRAKALRPDVTLIAGSWAARRPRGRARANQVQPRADVEIATRARRNRMGSFIDTRGWFCATSAPTRVEYLCPMVINQTIA
jgi:hypothetical protein